MAMSAVKEGPTDVDDATHHQKGMGQPACSSVQESSPAPSIALFNWMSGAYVWEAPARQGRPRWIPYCCSGTALILPLIVTVLVALAGCAGMSETQQRTLTGGTAGAAGGALIGAIAGNAGLGAAIGGATGLAGGFLYGKHEESKQQAYQQGVSAGKPQASGSR